MLSLALLSSAFVQPAAPPRVAARCAAARACDPIEVEVVDQTFEACMKMKIPEIKAELELRGVPFDGLFEKEEFAKRLAKSRSSGVADPSLMDKFNEQSAEAMMGDQPSAADVAAAVDASTTAGDGGLPGGMTPEQLQRLVSDPEIMSMLRDPKMQEVMKEVMSGGVSGLDAYQDDDEVRGLLEKMGRILKQKM